MKKILLTLFVMTLLVLPLKARSDTNLTQFGIGGPVMIVGADAYWGGNFFVMHKIRPNLELGVESGFHIYSSSAPGFSFTQWVFPILPSLFYNFQIDPIFTPFIGASMGVAIVHGNAAIDGITSNSGTSADFEGLIHLGCKFGEARNFFGDFQLGVISGTFAFLPTVGLFF